MMQTILPGFEPIGPQLKRCAECDQPQSLDQFYNDQSRRDGLTRLCRTCDAKRHRKRWRDNREKMRARSRQRYHKNLAENRERGAERRRSERGKAINRLAVKRYAERNQHKRAAHLEVRRAIATGILPRPDRCELSHLGNCSGRIEYHHDDYSQPLEVRALCVDHHAAEHHKPRSIPAPFSLFDLATGAPQWP